MLSNKKVVSVAFIVLVSAIIVLGLLYFQSTQKVINVDEIQTELADTKSTLAAISSSTPYPTYTAYPTYTPIPPTATTKPTLTAIPTLVPQYETKTLGPIWDWNTNYSVELTINEIRWEDQGKYNDPKIGNVYLVVFLTFKNMGPMEIFDLSSGNFLVLDKNGVLKDAGWGFDAETEQCEMEYIEQLLPDGQIDFCVVFEVTEEGILEFIYTPDPYERLREGKYISYIIRE